MFELAVGRYELIKAGDPGGAAGLVRRYRDQVGVLNSSRFDRELAAPCFQPAGWPRDPARGRGPGAR